jgi:hypothetical protein
VMNRALVNQDRGSTNSVRVAAIVCNVQKLREQIYSSSSSDYSPSVL